MAGILCKNGCMSYIANMDLEESFYIIDGVYKEYIDSRLYDRYILDNLLLQFNNNGMSYEEYLKAIKATKPKTTKAIEKKNIEQVKQESVNLLNEFKKGNFTRE